MEVYNLSAEREIFDRKVIERKFKLLTPEYLSRVKSSLSRFRRPIPSFVLVGYFYIPRSQIAEINIVNLADPYTSPAPQFAIIFSEFVIRDAPDEILGGLIAHEIAHACIPGDFNFDPHWKVDLLAAEFVGKNSILNAIEWFGNVLKSSEPDYFFGHCAVDFVTRTAKVAELDIL